MTGTPAVDTAQPGDLAEQVSATPWYHTIEIAPGVVTPGHIDWRKDVKRIFPDDLSGRRTLDVGTFDGFFAFSMEARGASVVAIDLPEIRSAEWPPLNRPALEATKTEWDLELGRGFAVAARALDSRVHRVPCNVYDLTPEIIGGPVDMAFVGSILLHLRDPVRALQNVLAALKPGGEAMVLEPFSLRDTILSPRRAAAHFEPLVTQMNWWRPNLACLAGWLLAAGFVDVRRHGLYRPPARAGMKQWHAVMTGRRTAG